MYAARATARSLKAATPNIDRPNNQGVHVPGQHLALGSNQATRSCPDARLKPSSTAHLTAIGGQFGLNDNATLTDWYRPSSTSVLPVRQPRPTASTNNYYYYSTPNDSNQRAVNQPNSRNTTSETSHSFTGVEASSRPLDNVYRGFHTPLAVSHGSFPSYEATTPLNLPYTGSQEDGLGEGFRLAQRQINAPNSQSMGGYLHTPIEANIDELPGDPAMMIPRKSQATSFNTSPTSYIYDDNPWPEQNNLPADSDHSYPVPNSRTFVPHGALPQGYPSFQVRHPNDTSSQRTFTRATTVNTPISLSTSLTRSTYSESHGSSLSTISALKCPQCGKEVSSAKDPNHRKSNLSRHMRVEHGEHPKVYCPEAGCRKAYKRSDALQKHRRNEHPRQH